jgi:hypothetical protein
VEEDFFKDGRELAVGLNLLFKEQNEITPDFRDNSFLEFGNSNYRYPLRILLKFLIKITNILVVKLRNIQVCRHQY